jgi:hypothetical protein
MRNTQRARSKKLLARTLGNTSNRLAEQFRTLILTDEVTEFAGIQLVLVPTHDGENLRNLLPTTAVQWMLFPPDQQRRSKGWKFGNWGVWLRPPMNVITGTEYSLLMKSGQCTN